MAERIRLYDLTYGQLAELLANWGEPRFRVDQVWKWLYRSCAQSFESMGNLPSVLRARLAAETELGLLTPLAEQQSAGGQTSKVLFRLHDGATIESVLMRYYRGHTACISTQAGCGMGCVFCATGLGGLVRNLSAGEIVAQVLYFARHSREAALSESGGRPEPAGPPITIEGRPTHGAREGNSEQAPCHPVGNIVLMGMGEPLANLPATWQAIETLTDARGYNLGARRITLSTVGLVPGIRWLAEKETPINLAVSLHAVDDDLRNRLVPLNRRYPLAELMAAVREYAQKTRRRVTFEYALISGVNDSPEQARRLAALIQGILCHVNLIPLNPTPGLGLQASPRQRVDAFRDALEAAGVPATVRVRRGIDIEAGCGQLRQRTSGIAAR